MAEEKKTLISPFAFYRSTLTQEVLRADIPSGSKSYHCTMGREVSYTVTANVDNILKNWKLITDEEILFNGSKIKIGPDGLEVKSPQTMDDLVILSHLDFEDYKPGLCLPFVIFLYDGGEYKPHVCYGVSIESGVKHLHLKPMDGSQDSLRKPVLLNLFATSRKADHYYGVNYHWDPTLNIVGFSWAGSPIFYAFEMFGQIFQRADSKEGYSIPSSPWVDGVPPGNQHIPNKIFYRSEGERQDLKKLATDRKIHVAVQGSASMGEDRLLKDGIVTKLVPVPKDEFGNPLQPIADIIPFVADGKPFVIYLKKDSDYGETYYAPHVVLGYLKESNRVLVLELARNANPTGVAKYFPWGELSSAGVAINPKTHFQIAGSPLDSGTKDVSGVVYVKDRNRGILGVMDSLGCVHYSVPVDNKEFIHVQTLTPGDNWKVVDPNTTMDTRKSGVHLCENLGEYQTLRNSIRRIEKDYGYNSNFRLELMEGGNPAVKPIASEENTLQALKNAVMAEEDAAVFAALDKIVAEMSTTSVDQPGIETKNKRSTPPSVGRKSTMSKMTDTLKNDGKEAAVRVAARQGTKLVVEPLAALLCRHMGDDSPEFRAKVGRFLQTDLGRAIAMGAFSAGLSALPLEGNHKDAIARELRVEAMAMLGDELAEVFIGPLREVTALYLKGFPQEEAPLEELPSGEVLSHASEGQEIGVVEKSLPVVRLVSRLNPSTSRLRGFS